MTSATINRRRMTETRAVQGTKDFVKNHGIQIAGTVFFGAAALICGAVTIELLMVGGFYGILGGILYLGFTALNGYYCYCFAANGGL